MKIYYTVQGRSDSGWYRIRGFKSEARALDTLRKLGDEYRAGTFRVITYGAGGAVNVVAVRAPAVCDDATVTRSHATR